MFTAILAIALCQQADISSTIVNEKVVYGRLRVVREPVQHTHYRLRLVRERVRLIEIEVPRTVIMKVPTTVMEGRWIVAPAVVPVPMSSPSPEMPKRPAPTPMS